MSEQSIATTGLGVFPAVVTMRAVDEAALERIRQRLTDPDILTEFPPFTWEAVISNNKLDAYFTRMMATSLRNYADDAEAGVAFQDSHKTDGMVRTLGHSLIGRYVGPGGDGIARTNAEFYTLTGLDPIIDSFVRRVRGGLARDVSIGFYGGKYTCSICGRDMLRDWDCWHIPGFEYVVVDDKGNKTDKKVLATADIDNARLSEVSTVYDGATPGAAIIKAQREADAGRLRPEQATLLEARYRVHLSGAAQIFRGATVETKETPMPADPTSETTPAPEPRELLPAAIRSLFTQVGVTAEDTESGVRDLVEEIQRLRPLAADGKTYRSDLIKSALAEGARAHGEAFTPDPYLAILEAAPIETIKRMHNDWAAIGDKQFPGGRSTVDDDEQAREPQAAQNGVPDAAYKTRR